MAPTPHSGSADREEFHLLIDGLDDDVLRAALHALVDTLPDTLVGVALRRIRALQACLPIEPPELFNK